MFLEDTSKEFKASIINTQNGWGKILANWRQNKIPKRISGKDDIWKV